MAEQKNEKQSSTKGFFVRDSTTLGHLETFGAKKENLENPEKYKNIRKDKKK